MKKEKTVRTYQRRTKTGKLVTVKQHTAKYDAAEMLKEAAKKKGAGEELDKLKKKAQVKPTVEPEIENDALGFTADEFKQWYHWDMENDPKNKAAKKVEKALKERMGTKGYRQYFDEMTDNYSVRGHNKAFKEISLNTDDPRETAAKMSKYESKRPQKAKESLVEHYDQFNTKYMGKAASEPFRFKEKETGITYDAQFVTDGKGRYGYVVKDAADGKKGKFYVAIDESSSMSELNPAVRKAAKAAGLTLKNGEWKSTSKEGTPTKSDKTKKKETKIDKLIDDAKAQLSVYKEKRKNANSPANKEYSKQLIKAQEIYIKNLKSGMSPAKAFKDSLRGFSEGNPISKQARGPKDYYEDNNREFPAEKSFEEKNEARRRRLLKNGETKTSKPYEGTVKPKALKSITIGGGPHGGASRTYYVDSNNEVYHSVGKGRYEKLDAKDNDRAMVLSRMNKEALAKEPPSTRAKTQKGMLTKRNSKTSKKQ